MILRYETRPAQIAQTSPSSEMLYSTMGKRDHYLPQFYLNFFLSEDESSSFWVYDKKGGAPRPQTPVNTGIEGHLYRLEDSKITNPNFIDEIFFQPAESAVAPILAERLLLPGTRLQDRELPILADFLALMHIRVPRTQQMIKEVGETALTHLLNEEWEKTEELSATLKELKDAGCEVPSSIEEARATWKRVKRTHNVMLTKKPAMLLSLMAAGTVAKQLLEMNWCLCSAPADSFFITGDAPLVIFILDEQGNAGFGQGLAEQQVEVTFPLSPQKCLYLCRRRIPGYWPMGKKNIEDINRRTAYMAERFIISGKRTKGIAALVEESSTTLSKPKIERKEMLKEMRLRKTQHAREN